MGAWSSPWPNKEIFHVQAKKWQWTTLPQSQRPELIFWNVSCSEHNLYSSIHFSTFSSLTVCILLQRAALLVLMTSQENAFHSLTFLWHRSLLLEVNILSHFSRISYSIRQHFCSELNSLKATKNIWLLWKGQMQQYSAVYQRAGYGTINL